jgi:hypothetical protein
MTDFLSIIRLKDKLIIASLMLAFAISLAVSIGVVTAATVDPHNHSYAYHIERADGDNFVVVGVCADKACKDPENRWPIVSFSDIIVTTPTCCKPGNTRYVLITDVLEGESKTYILDEPIPQLPHKYQGNVKVSDDGTGSVNAICTNEGCTSPQLKIEKIESGSLKLEEFKAATCRSDRYEKYSYTSNGITSTIESYIKETAPHSLNGKYATEYEIGGYFIYGTDGVKLEGVQSLACGETANGSYVCEVCGKTQQVKVFKKDHSFTYDPTQTVLPTDKNTGIAVVVCSEADCGKSKSILLPKVIVGIHAEVISQDPVKETQTVKYTYVDGDYMFVVESEMVIPWDHHLYEYTEDDIVYPTVDSEGSVVVRCKNSICSKQEVITLPKIIVGDNTDITYDHILEKQTYTYHYTNSSLGIDITYSYDAPWINHTYEYQESETVLPTLKDSGVAYVRCSYDGCEKYHEITLKKVVVGDNAQIIAPATEAAAAVARYTYADGDYGFVVSFELSVGSPLTHAYKYKLELNVLTGKFDLVGKCDACNDQIREENVAVETEEHSATCTEDGYIIVRHKKDGIVYSLRMSNGLRTGHDYAETNKIEPTFSKDGSVTLDCRNDGCDVNVTLTLPKMVMNENTVIISEKTEASAEIARYSYINFVYDYSL